MSLILALVASVRPLWVRVLTLVSISSLQRVKVMARRYMTWYTTSTITPVPASTRRALKVECLEKFRFSSRLGINEFQLVPHTESQASARLRTYAHPIDSFGDWACAVGLDCDSEALSMQSFS